MGWFSYAASWFKEGCGARFEPSAGAGAAIAPPLPPLNHTPRARRRKSRFSASLTSSGWRAWNTRTFVAPARRRTSTKRTRCGSTAPPAASCLSALRPPQDGRESSWSREEPPGRVRLRLPYLVHGPRGDGRSVVDRPRFDERAPARPREEAP